MTTNLYKIGFLCISLLCCCFTDNCNYYKTTLINFETEFNTTGGADNDDATFFGFPWYQAGVDRRDDDFSKISQSPESYLKCFQVFIMDKSINHRKKHMALYSMRLLPIEKYTIVVNSLNTAFKQGLINEQTLETAITQDGIWNNTFLVYFSNPKFQKVFKEVLNNPRLSKKTRTYLKNFEKLSFRNELLDAFNRDRGY